MSTLLCGNTSSVIAFRDYFYFIFTLWASHYHFPLTEEETENTENATDLPKVTASKWQHC